MGKIVITFIAVLTIVLTSCGRKSENSSNKKISGDLIIFHAGSLSVPFKKIKKEFNKRYPDVNVLLESAGSRACARKITELKKSCDIMASADYTVIDELLVPEYAAWNIKFATNEMCIVYHKSSRRSKEINRGNWYKILMDQDIAFGRSDPNSDPCGYRAVLAMKLAGKYYNSVELAEKLLNKDKNYIRPKETDLLALLESNTIDYLFLYRSVAQQHELDYLILPDEINLKSAELAVYYKTATVDVTGKKPGKFITKKGAPMVYGITIPKNASNPKAALAFVNFVLSKEKGMKIMEKQGQPSAVPSKSETFEKIPEQLKKYAKK